MAKLKKRAKAQQRNPVTARGKARKATKSKQPGAPPVETVVVDVIEKPAPDVITITEFEETEVREGIPGRDEPDFTGQR